VDAFIGNMHPRILEGLLANLMREHHSVQISAKDLVQLIAEADSPFLHAYWLRARDIIKIMFHTPPEPKTQEVPIQQGVKSSPVNGLRRGRKRQGQSKV
jgi:hypothetical protein